MIKNTQVGPPTRDHATCSYYVNTYSVTIDIYTHLFEFEYPPHTHTHLPPPMWLLSNCMYMLPNKSGLPGYIIIEKIYYMIIVPDSNIVLSLLSSSHSYIDLHIPSPQCIPYIYHRDI